MQIGMVNLYYTFSNTFQLDFVFLQQPPLLENVRFYGLHLYILMHSDTEHFHLQCVWRLLLRVGFFFN
jgi:hypothetical protein